MTVRRPWGECSKNTNLFFVMFITRVEIKNFVFLFRRYLTKLFKRRFKQISNRTLRMHHGFNAHDARRIHIVFRSGLRNVVSWKPVSIKSFASTLHRFVRRNIQNIYLIPITEPRRVSTTFLEEDHQSNGSVKYSLTTQAACPDRHCLPQHRVGFECSKQKRVTDVTPIVNGQSRI